MALTTFLIAVTVALSSQQRDSAWRVADTLRIEPLGIRFTVPPLWMGRVPDGVSANAPGPGRLACQFRVTGPVEDRIVTATAALSQLKGGIFPPRSTYRAALDSIVPGVCRAALS
jgi:hypothetical protein